MADSKPILCLDFDGVLHAYTSGWQGGDVIGDGPVPGAMAWLRDAVETFEVHVLSSRSRVQKSRELMRDTLKEWLIEKHGEVIGRVVHQLIHFPDYKPSAFLTIDDRSLCFTGTFPDPASLLTFKPWNKA
jgi:hypothetical protein